jgi:F-type H+-transporting ATPase subunit epsilon
MVTPLAIDVLRFVKQGQKEQIAIMGGILRTNGKEVSVLADAAELATEIDLVRAQQAKERAEARLRQLNSTVDEGRAKLAMTRALTRIRLKQTKP